MATKTVALINTNRLKPAPAPVGLDYLAAELKQKCHEVHILDLAHVRNIRQAVKDFFSKIKPDLVGITIRNLDDVVYNLFLAEEIKPIIDLVKRSTDAQIVLGGSGFSIAPEAVLEYFSLDLGIAGEGEASLAMLVDVIGDKEKYEEIPGLVWKNERGFRKNPIGMSDVNAYALEKRCVVCHKTYSYKKGTRGGAGVQTKRGCANKCIYCVVPNIEGEKVRLREPGKIAEEIESLQSRGISRIFLADSEFNQPFEQAYSICEEFIRRGLESKIKWQAYLSPSETDIELAPLMKRAGCEFVYITIDSAVDSLLERWNKPFRQDQIRTTVEAFRKAQIDAVYCLCIGGPGETLETLMQTISFIQALKPIKLNFGEPPGLRVYPNTPLAELVKQEGFNKKNRNLRGSIECNENLLRPVYYLSAELGGLTHLIQAYRKIGEINHKVAKTLQNLGF